ncbi:scaffoldin [Anaeromyces robustus]|uniref:Scaffoldin n=1 Tax=Anaeromyces robustus TaxID=1754192 RepID=A0A1Y1WVH1_9FUNG|nr:scaffoldin [Anaeromyces robustus]|eukprot:ORX77206.1 scaffoldin [Anaeromyces robustus]
MNIKRRNWNHKPLQIIVILLSYAIHKSFATLKSCNCVDFYGTNDIYCVANSKLCLIKEAFPNQDDCNTAYDGGNGDLSTTAAVTSISGVSSDEWVFFTENGSIISSTISPTTSITNAEGFKFSSSTFSSITKPTKGSEYYLNKYGGGNQIISVDSNNSYKIVRDIGENQAYISDGANSIILCSGSSTCELIAKADVANHIYVNADDYKSVIIYDTADLNIDTDLTKFPYFIYEMGENDGLIDCSSGICSVFKVIPNYAMSTNGIYAAEGYYLGGGYDTTGSSIEKKLIQCTSDFGCIEVTLPAVESYYINTGASKATYPLIKYDGSSTLSLEAGIAETYYINADISDNTKPLIYCESTTSCSVVGADESNYYLSYDNNLIIYSMDTPNSGWKYEKTITGYVINGRPSHQTKPLIYCSAADTCNEITVETNGFYIFKNTNFLITCTTTSSCYVLSDEAEEGYYLNSQDIDNASNPLISCTENSCITIAPDDAGYFLDQSTFSNNKYHGLIYCSSTTLCNTSDIIPGFYVNEGAEDEIIECQISCVSKPANPCIADIEKVIISSGNYCYSDSVLSFVYNSFELNLTRSELDPSEASNYLVSVTNDDSSQANYIYASVNADVFPGITSTISTLFKVSKNSIVKVIEDGIIIINKKNNIRLFNFAESFSLNSIYNLYQCEKSSSKCKPVKSCSSEMYIYDSKSEKGLYCNGSNLYSITIPGYYLDGSRVNSNKKTPYVLKCDSSSKCISLKPENVYFINSGYDSATKKLIACNSNECETKVGNTGYYLAYNGEGIIKCTSSTKCTNQTENSFRYFLNADVLTSNTLKLLIQCQYGVCNLISPHVGYYITHTSSILINCTSKLHCTELNVSDGYYNSGYKGTISTKYIIHCLNVGGKISCNLEPSNTGLYVSNDSNTLVDCNDDECKPIIVTNGIFRSATTTISSNNMNKRNEIENNINDKNMKLKFIVHKDKNIENKKKKEDIEEEVEEEEDEEGDNDNTTLLIGNRKNHLYKKDTIYNLIQCDLESCRELSPAELAAVPICTFNSNKCFISYEYSLTSQATTVLSPGGYCTNSNRSKIYFATDSIVVESNIISGSNIAFSHTTTDTNCLEVSKAYKSYYFTVGSTIYHLDDNRITQIVNTGYYFINIVDNTLVTGRTIDEYNNNSVKIFKCNGVSCSIIDNLKTISYFADVNKKIIKYDPEIKKYSYAYNKDIVCSYSKNKCTPKYDLEKREFCITYLGELTLASQDIKSHESGDCYKSNTIDSSIYGYSQYLYKMDQFSAIMVDNTAYYLVTKSTNSTAEVKDYSNKPKSIVIYGCIKKNCDIYDAKEKVYYYDNNKKSMYRLVDGVWKAPSKGGYAYISISPNEDYVYKFNIKNNEINIEKKVSTGFYYTVDGEMFECSNDDCQPITDSGYVFTNNGEIYYCEYDSEELEETVCKLQSCVLGQYYYIDGYYYRCDSGSVLNLLTSKNCVQSAKYIINFPTILSDDYPSKVRTAVDRIARKNRSTATVKKGRNYLPVVPAVYTNCDYNFEDKEVTFDLICVRNYVILNNENEPEICSESNMGYVVCSEDPENPDKCNPSLAYRNTHLSIFSIIIINIITSTILFIYHL